jgi:hypothetical protein
MANEHEAAELIDEIVLGSARGGRIIASELFVDVVRPLTPEDVPMLNMPVKSSLPGTQTIRHSHHKLAQLIVQGIDQETCSLMTGYAPSVVSNLQRDPAFQELIAYYRSERQIVFVDVLERMKVLGLSTLDELQHRLELEPEKFSKRELLEMAKLLLIEPQNKSAGGGQAPSALTLNVEFVTATPVQPVVTIDQEPK